MTSKTQTVMNDMRYSLQQVEKAKPIIKQLLNGGDIKIVEGDDNEICLMLDQTCGTDYFQAYGKNDGQMDGLVWGIGSRFQKTWHNCQPFNTFTIRRSRESGAKTEFEKREYAMKHGGIYPYLTMHGYYDEQTGEILSLAIARTKDIWDFIKQGHAKERHTGDNQIGQATFYFIGWDDFKKRGYDIKIYQKSA